MARDIDRILLIQCTSSRASSEPLPSQMSVGPSSSQGPEELTAITTDDDKITSAASSDTVESLDLDAEDVHTTTSFELQNRANDDEPCSGSKVSSPVTSTFMQDDTEGETLASPQKDGSLSPDLDPIDSLGLMTFSSQISGESLRRLALSPRKAKKTMNMLPGVTASPISAARFLDKLTAVMNESGADDDEDNLLRSSSKPKVLNFAEEMDPPEEQVVEGSDPESETDWNDEKALTSPSKAKLPVMDGKDNNPLIDSEDDIPTLKKFTSRKTPMMLEESDSDLDDNLLFGSPLSGLTTSSATSVSSVNGAQDEQSLEMELSDTEDQPTKGQQQGMRRSTRTLTSTISGRNLRSSVPKPVSMPLTPPRPTPKPVRTNKKPLMFSLDSLLKEKKRRAEVGYDIKTAGNNMTLDDELIDEYDDAEDDEAVFGPEMIPKGVLSEEQEGVLTEIIEEEQNNVVEDIAEFFVGWPQELSVQPLEAELDGADACDPVVQKVVKCTRTETQRNQFLTSPFLMIMSSTPWTMPRSLFRWLIQVVAVEEHQPVTLSVVALLQRIISQRTSLLGVDHQDLVRVFGMYGAKDECLDLDWKVTPVTRETRTERVIFPETKKFPRQNLKAIIKLVNMTATLDPQFYNVDEVRKIISLLLRMTTDPIIGDFKSLLGSAIVALLDAIPASVWETERLRLSEDIISSLGTSLPFILLTLHQLPSLSLRITILRRSIALAYLQQPPLPAGESAPNLEELHRALFIDKGFLINAETKYKDLGRRIQVFGFCLDDEQMISAYGRKALEPLLKKLRHMHGRIVDVRAAFMERTLTKDIIQRLYMRLYYSGIHRQTAKQSTLDFGASTAIRTVGSRPGQTDVQSTIDHTNLRLVPELMAPSHDDPSADAK
ncbi:hypothetical protein EDD11_002935 [Mortierella claussenii]|nr:hypothetical protein EDD11_002935 [Mortierella claussenii]